MKACPRCVRVCGEDVLIEVVLREYMCLRCIEKVCSGCCIERVPVV